MRIFENMNKIEYNLQLARMPITVMHCIVFLSINIFEYNHGISWIRVFFMFILFLVFNNIHWHSDIVLKRLGSSYFVLLGMIILCLVLLMPKSTIIILLGLMPVFIVQGILYFEKKWRGITLVIGYYTFSSVMIYINYAFEDLLIFFTLFTSMLALMAIVILIFSQQQLENQKLQFYVEELELASKKIEQLTLKNERNRMARDLHDTLAQRLVGIVLKLEASESYLEQGRVEKSKAIISTAIEQARQSVHEARNVIDDLREQDSLYSFNERIYDEIEQLHWHTDAKISLQIDSFSDLPITIEEHIISIIREGVHNAKKHANATAIDIALTMKAHELQLCIYDNGTGIDVKTKLSHGHYGILGMKERARLMQGTFSIDNKSGTVITIVIPMK